jgi:hypothetical protein
MPGEQTAWSRERLTKGFALTGPGVVRTASERVLPVMGRDQEEESGASLTLSGHVVPAVRLEELRSSEVEVDRLDPRPWEVEDVSLRVEESGSTGRRRLQAEAQAEG